MADLVSRFQDLTGTSTELAELYLALANNEFLKAVSLCHQIEMQTDDCDKEFEMLSNQLHEMRSACTATSTPQAPQERAKFRSMVDVLSEMQENQRQVENSRQEYLTFGGSRSALKVYDPRDRPLNDIAAKLLARASASSSPWDTQGTSLGASTQTRPTVVVITFWREGFTVDNEPLRLDADPYNEELLNILLETGRLPSELAKDVPSQTPVTLHYVDHRFDPYRQQISGLSWTQGGPPPPPSSFSSPFGEYRPPPSASFFGGGNVFFHAPFFSECSFRPCSGTLLIFCAFPPEKAHQSYLPEGLIRFPIFVASQYRTYNREYHTGNVVEHGLWTARMIFRLFTSPEHFRWGVFVPVESLPALLVGATLHDFGKTGDGQFGFHRKQAHPEVLMQYATLPLFDDAGNGYLFPLFPQLPSHFLVSGHLPLSGQTRLTNETLFTHTPAIRRSPMFTRTDSCFHRPLQLLVDRTLLVAICDRHPLPSFDCAKMADAFLQPLARPILHAPRPLLPEDVDPPHANMLLELQDHHDCAAEYYFNTQDPHPSAALTHVFRFDAFFNTLVAEGILRRPSLAQWVGPHTVTCKGSQTCLPFWDDNDVAIAKFAMQAHSYFGFFSNRFNYEMTVWKKAPDEWRALQPEPLSLIDLCLERRYRSRPGNPCYEFLTQLNAVATMVQLSELDAMLHPARPMTEPTVMTGADGARLVSETIKRYQPYLVGLTPRMLRVAVAMAIADVAAQDRVTLAFPEAKPPPRHMPDHIRPTVTESMRLGAYFRGEGNITALPSTVLRAATRIGRLFGGEGIAAPGPSGDPNRDWIPIANPPLPAMPPQIPRSQRKDEGLDEVRLTESAYYAMPVLMQALPLFHSDRAAHR
ncbi:putative UBX domain-containing protein 1 [Paratrimastix pyriformis]|uniref:UBX domain-containing protein 1 n=1 Tax=Paratrimastix pyriformis TaxID=342808 RepID=A0ABQ8UUQ4_9EUKA|nr:putative UBX domain-containing protein 1 [Paratrimastix pyriformis]